MFFRILTIALVAFFSFVSAASALTTEEIENAWAKTANLSGSFIERYDDGYVQTGRFYVIDPTLVHLVYENGTTFTVNGGAQRSITIGGSSVSANAGKVTVVDSYNGEEATQNLGPFGSLFSRTPDLSEVQSGTGESSRHLVVRMRDPRAPNQGYVDVYFNKSTGLMERWISEIQGQRTQTDFRY